MSLDEDCPEVAVTPYLKLLVTFGMILREFVMSFIHNSTTSSHLIRR
jgi:hypothetical protein